MIVAGIDLAAEPRGTALTLLQISTESVAVTEVKVGLTDADLVSLTDSAVKIGIDCALGWPIAFAEFIAAQSSTTDNGPVFEGDIDFRRRLAYRDTDRAVHELTGRWPLSVSTDRLGMAAIRCAGLVSALGATGANVSRAGDGKVVEVYPAGAIRLWNIESAGYRQDSQKRSRLLNDIKLAAPWLELGKFGPALVESCDAFDSLLAALSAYAAALGLSTVPSAEQLPLARIEGWVHLPTTKLEYLNPAIRLGLES